jgi:hypothetical protein
VCSSCSHSHIWLLWHVLMSLTQTDLSVSTYSCHFAKQMISWQWDNLHCYLNIFMWHHHISCRDTSVGLHSLFMNEWHHDKEFRHSDKSIGGSDSWVTQGQVHTKHTTRQDRLLYRVF